MGLCHHVLATGIIALGSIQAQDTSPGFQHVLDESRWQSRYSLVPFGGSLEFSEPVALVSPDRENKHFFVVERLGKIFQVHVSDEAEWKNLFLDLSQSTSAPMYEAGLLGLAFHPEYSTNGRFFV